MKLKLFIKYGAPYKIKSFGFIFKKTRDIMLFQISDTAVQELIAVGTQIGLKRGLEYIGEAPRLISQNRAYRQFLRARVSNWVKDGKIKAISNNKDKVKGTTSTVYYDYATLLALDAGKEIVIYQELDIN